MFSSLELVLAWLKSIQFSKLILKQPILLINLLYLQRYSKHLALQQNHDDFTKLTQNPNIIKNIVIGKMITYP
jgi:hypothetical protein